VTFFDAETQYANDEHNHNFDCFPRIPGASQRATITQTLNSAPMTKPLDVTCTTVSVDWIDGMDGWTIKLRQTWAIGECDMTSTTTAAGLPESGSFETTGESS
jgi:hypothetical protein